MTYEPSHSEPSGRTVAQGMGANASGYDIAHASTSEGMETSPSTAMPFKIGIELPSQVPVSDAIKDALSDIGVQYVNYYTYLGGSEAQAIDVNNAMMGLCRDLDMLFSLSCYHIDPPDAVVQAAAKEPLFRGIVFDELEHVRLLFQRSPELRIADPSAFHSLDQAYDGTLEGFSQLKAKFDMLSTSVTATHVWPVLHHVAARAGFTVCPKICKEFFSTVSLAVGLGAAKQYGRDLWVDVDQWFYDLLPGHPAEEVKSNLLLAYWLGADLVYLEGCGKNLAEPGSQGTPFTLIKQPFTSNYQLTEYGEMLRWFIKEYVPSHPRPWTFRDVQPEVAMIRFPDTCFGQRYTPYWADQLYGSPNLHSNTDTEAWFQLWNLLTFGKTGRDGISYYKLSFGTAGASRPNQPGMLPSWESRPDEAGVHRFFVPMNGVLVYDHLVGYDLLKDIPLLCLTGTRVSEPTMAAITQCVEQGATCVAWGPLAKQHGLAWTGGVKVVTRGQGKFVITDDFGFGSVINEIADHLGSAAEIRYRFSSPNGTQEVVFQPGDEQSHYDNVTEVNVRPARTGPSAPGQRQSRTGDTWA